MEYTFSAVISTLLPLSTIYIVWGWGSFNTSRGGHKRGGTPWEPPRIRSLYPYSRVTDPGRFGCVDFFLSGSFEDRAIFQVIQLSFDGGGFLCPLQIARYVNMLKYIRKCQNRFHWPLTNLQVYLFFYILYRVCNWWIWPFSLVALYLRSLKSQEADSANLYESPVPTHWMLSPLELCPLLWIL